MHSAIASADRSAAAVHPLTRMGAVRLRSPEVQNMRRFYEAVIGLESSEHDDGRISMRVPAGEPLLELVGGSSAAPVDRRSPGLFHLAMLVPSRLELARALARLTRAGWYLDGASDHLVSEALYLSDPDGNGIEIYRDRRREEWPHRDGTLQMATMPLDLHDLLSELDDSGVVPDKLPAGSTIGHVHLQVSDLAAAEVFYNGILGFDVTVRGYPGALFVSAGGYHHHLGLNTWNSAGAAPAMDDSAGLAHFEILLPDSEALEQILQRVGQAQIKTQPGPGGTLVRDPSGSSVLLRSVT